RITPALGEAFLTSAIRFSGLRVGVVTARKKLRGRSIDAIVSRSCSTGTRACRSATSWRLVARICSRIVLMIQFAAVDGRDAAGHFIPRHGDVNLGPEHRGAG